MLLNLYKKLIYFYGIISLGSAEKQSDAWNWDFKQSLRKYCKIHQSCCRDWYVY